MSTVSTFHSTHASPTIPSGHVVVTWPLSQDLMAEWWFPEEAQLITGGLLEEIFGGCAYVIPRKRVKTDLVGVHSPQDVKDAIEEVSDEYPSEERAGS